jgi:hypothetical protein
MAQRISQMPNEAIPFAQEALPYSSVERGIGAMTLPNAGMRNMNDGGAYTKFVNPQGQRNQQQQIQNIQQNAIAAAPQGAASAMGQVTNQMTQQSTAEYKAQLGMNTTIANVMEATGSGAATMEMGNPLMLDKRMNDIAVSRAMGSMQAAELGQIQAESGRYRQA